jgi:hypothetical protein
MGYNGSFIEHFDVNRKINIVTVLNILLLKNNNITIAYTITAKFNVSLSK